MRTRKPLLRAALLAAICLSATFTVVILRHVSTQESAEAVESRNPSSRSDNHGAPKDVARRDRAGHSTPSKTTSTDDSVEPAPVVLASGVFSITCVHPSAEPYPRLLVTLEPLNGFSPPRQELTDTLGRAVFKELPPGHYRFVLSGEDIPELRTAAAEFLGAGDEKERRLTVGPFDRSIAGRLVDAEEEGVAGVSLTAKPSSRPRVGELVVIDDDTTFTVESDAGGHFAIDGLLPGDYLVSTAETRVFSRTHCEIPAGAKAADIVLVEKTTPQIYGRVVCATDGGAIRDARVTLLGKASSERRVDGEGNYFLDFEVAAGLRAVVFEARARRYGTRRITLPIEEFARRPHCQRLDFHLQHVGDLVPLQGVVLDSDETPLPKQTVIGFSPSLEVRRRAITNARGRFRMEVPSAADLRITVLSRGFKPYSKVAAEAGNRPSGDRRGASRDRPREGGAMNPASIRRTILRRLGAVSVVGLALCLIFPSPTVHAPSRETTSRAEPRVLSNLPAAAAPGQLPVEGPRSSAGASVTPVGLPNSSATIVRVETAEPSVAGGPSTALVERRPTTGASASEGAETPLASRHVDIHDGRFRLHLEGLPSRGSGTASLIIVSLFDYACPHSRDMYRLLSEALERYEEELAVVYLPVPMDARCNPLLRSTPTQRNGACRYAALGLAVWFAQPQAFWSYSDGLLSGSELPCPSAATREAAGILGKDGLREALGDRRVALCMKDAVAIFASNVQKARTHTLPQLIIGSEIVVGASPDAESLYRIIDRHLASER